MERSLRIVQETHWQWCVKCTTWLDAVGIPPCCTRTVNRVRTLGKQKPILTRGAFLSILVATLVATKVVAPDLIPREQFVPPGYPLQWEYGPCDQPQSLDDMGWLRCMIMLGW